MGQRDDDACFGIHELDRGRDHADRDKSWLISPVEPSSSAQPSVARHDRDQQRTQHDQQADAAPGRAHPAQDIGLRRADQRRRSASPGRRSGRSAGRLRGNSCRRRSRRSCRAARHPGCRCRSRSSLSDSSAVIASGTSSSTANSARAGRLSRYGTQRRRSAGAGGDAACQGGGQRVESGTAVMKRQPGRPSPACPRGASRP